MVKPIVISRFTVPTDTSEEVLAMASVTGRSVTDVCRTLMRRGLVLSEQNAMLGTVVTMLRDAIGNGDRRTRDNALRLLDEMATIGAPPTESVPHGQDQVPSGSASDLD